MFKFKKKLLQQEQGFTLVEVIIAILIATIFVAVTMQAMVIAVALKVKAKYYSDANNAIQTDLENVRYKASIAQLPYDATKCNASAADTGYADALRDKVLGTNQTGTNDYVDHPTIPSSTNRTLYMTRKMILPTTTPPFDVLTLNYTVTLDSASGSSVASISTKVIPDAAFKCP